MNHTGGVGRAVDWSRRDTAAGTWVGIFLIVSGYYTIVIRLW